MALDYASAQSRSAVFLSPPLTAEAVQSSGLQRRGAARRAALAAAAD